MFLEAISAVSVQPSANLGPLSNLPNSAALSSSFSPSLNSLSGSCFPSSSSSASSGFWAKKRDNGFAAGASNHAVSLPLTGVAFQPFEEVKKDEFLVPVAHDASLARQRFSKECEAAINEQIK